MKVRGFLQLKAGNGFTLIEVMAAMFVVSVALIALSDQVQSLLSARIHTEEKTIASWVAENRYEEFLIERKLAERTTGNNRARNQSRQKVEIDKVTFAGQEWTTRLERIETPVDRITRIDVSAGLVEDAWLITLSGFVYDTPSP